MYGDDWLYSEVQNIYEAAYDISAYANNTIKNGAGLGWMDAFPIIPPMFFSSFSSIFYPLPETARYDWMTTHMAEWIH